MKTMCPVTLRQVLELEAHEQSEATRKRLKHLAFLPLSTPFMLAELDCGALVGPEVRLTVRCCAALSALGGTDTHVRCRC